MALKTDAPDPTPDVAAFYDRLAPTYDAMTGPEQRFIRERPFFSELVERHGLTTAVDVGCGTGFHALMLAELGVRVTAVDLSPHMLARLAANAESRHLHVSTVQAPLLELPARLGGTYDAVLCMGNTLAHLLTREELDRALRGFAAVLRPGGILLLQVLNYERVLAQRERIQSVREGGGDVFVRFYDFGEELLRFNILRLERTAQGIRPHLSSIDLRPVLRGEVETILAGAGCGAMQFCSDIAMDPFDPGRSADLVVLAERQPVRTAR